MSNVYSIDQIDEVEIRRISTEIPDLDEIIGTSAINRKYFSNGQLLEEAHIERGFPRGCISLWSGEAGVGKTRIVTQIAKNINSKGRCILVFPGEIDEQQYKTSTGYIRIPEIYFVSDSTILSEQLNIINNPSGSKYSFCPDLIIIDSVDMLDGFNSPVGIRNIMNEYKKKAYETNSHIIFIAHQNKEGDVKGNTDLSHLVDSVFMLNKYVPPKFIVDNSGRRIKTDEIMPKLDKKTLDEIRSIFYIEVGKNRGGKSGGKLYFKHTDNGVEYCGYNINIIVPTTQTAEVSNIIKREPIVGVDINMNGKKMNFFDRLFFSNFGG